MAETSAKEKARAIYEQFKYLESDPFLQLDVKRLLSAVKAVADGEEGAKQQ